MVVDILLKGLLEVLKKSKAFENVLFNIFSVRTLTTFGSFLHAHFQYEKLK